MASNEKDMTSGRAVQARAVRMSSRPPERFTATSDLVLWLKGFSDCKDCIFRGRGRRYSNVDFND